MQLITAHATFYIICTKLQLHEPHNFLHSILAIVLLCVTVPVVGVLVDVVLEGVMVKPGTATPSIVTAAVVLISSDAS